MSTIDWSHLAERLADVQRRMVHEEGYCGPDFYAEALRRAFEYTPANEPNATGRVLPYEQIRVPGLVTQAEADHLREGHVIVDRMTREAAEKRMAEMRVEMQRVYREAAADLAKYIRERCNEVSVPSRYRREGVELAADWIDPAVPKDRYGNLLPRKGEAGPA